MLYFIGSVMAVTWLERGAFSWGFEGVVFVVVAAWRSIFEGLGLRSGC